MANLDDSARRHLQRRLAFAATADGEQLVGLGKKTAVRQLIESSKQARFPLTPPVAQGTWNNRALRYPDTTPTQLTALNNEVSRANLAAAEQLRQAWLREMIEGSAPLRENIVVFLHSTLGGSVRTIDGPQALYGYVSTLRNHAFGTIPDLLEALILNPAMMMQENYDETRKELPSEYSARQILNKWTVGEGNYRDSDVEGLARSLTGWILEAAPGEGPARPLDPRGFRANRRTGLVPTFHSDLFDDQPKTIFGETRNFGARDAVRLLALQDATARRYASLLIRYFGVVDPNGRLQDALTETYKKSGGSLERMVHDLAMSEEFWDPQSRWMSIKSPVQLAVGFCRQLQFEEPPVAAISAWLDPAGQRLLDSPNFGAAGWKGQEDWLNPANRLSARYELGELLLAKKLPVRLQKFTPRALVALLDPAPGVDRNRVNVQDRAAAIRSILATPESQVS